MIDTIKILRNGCSSYSMFLVHRGKVVTNTNEAEIHGIQPCEQPMTMTRHHSQNNSHHSVLKTLYSSVGIICLMNCWLSVDLRVIPFVKVNNVFKEETIQITSGKRLRTILYSLLKPIPCGIKRILIEHKTILNTGIGHPYCPA